MTMRQVRELWMKPQGDETMTTATKKPRQTSSNNNFLCHVRGLMNQTIYRKAETILNRDGEDAARAYLGQFFKSGQYPG
jgi:hypothetical protein